MDSDKPLTPTMKRCIKHMASIGGTLTRYPGGYWAERLWPRWHRPWFGTSTVEALIARGLAGYTEWKEGRAGKFPTAVTLTYKARNLAQANPWTYEEMGV